MLRRSLRTALTTLVVVLTVTVLPGPASAGVTCPDGMVPFGASGSCVVASSAPGTPSTPAGSDPGSGGSSTSKPVCSAGGVEIPCTQPWGVWNADMHCYLAKEVPQPPFTSTLWEGHTDGAVYDCFGTDGMPMIARRWYGAPPPAPVDPAALAGLAVSRMPLSAITIGIVPEPGAGRLGLVGLPVYLWVARPAPSSYGPITRSATQGGVTVTAVGHVEKIVWSMGDGHSVTCTGTGTPYLDSYGDRPSPTCGYTYPSSSSGRPGGAYPVSATSSWLVTWAGGGGSGWFRFTFTSRVQIRIGEVQVLVH